MKKYIESMKQHFADNKRRYMSISAVMAFMAIFASEAYAAATTGSAGTGGAEMSSIYNKLVEWITGIPGKMVALAALAAAMYNVVQQNWWAAAGALIGAVLLSQSSGIIDNLFGASLPMLQEATKTASLVITGV